MRNYKQMNIREAHTEGVSEMCETYYPHSCSYLKHMQELLLTWFFSLQKCIMGDVVAVRTYVKEAWCSPHSAHYSGRIAGWQAQFNERNTKLK